MVARNDTTPTPIGSTTSGNLVVRDHDHVMTLTREYVRSFVGITLERGHLVPVCIATGSRTPESGA